ncbi:MAG TPA: hypothetical protein DCY13_03520 [Verrucomicrobiales bacterium]|nr:hypothetical protein [Verrucomicrobiales bacterium]
MKTKPSHRLSSLQSLATNRRRFLRGLGVALAVPAFESMLPAAATRGSSQVRPPRRVAFCSIPNGVQQDNWWPAGEGRDFVLNQTMKPLEPFKDAIQVIGGLDHENATPGPDGGGDHARANATLLTGVRARKTAGADIQLGVSIDQIIANRIGDQTRFASLELTCDKVRKAGQCDSGYSCAYLYNISWRSATTPMTPESNPRLLFERLFGTGEGASVQQQRQQEQKSILDFILNDARALRRELAHPDQQKLEEYLTGVRELEQRIDRAEKFGDLPEVQMAMPPGTPPNFGEHMDLMFEILALAFQTDSTRVGTLLLAGDGTNYAFPQIGIPEGHHWLTHDAGSHPHQWEKVARIDQYYAEHFARFLGKLKAMKDVDGSSVLDNSMIFYGGAIADGNRHNHENLPVVLAGGGGGTLTAGRFVKFPSQPMSNLFLSLADRMGVDGLERFGDSTGRIGSL